MEHPFLDEISAYCDAAGISETTFGGRAVKDSRFVEALRKGRVTVHRIERAREWMRNNPPRGMEAA